MRVRLLIAALVAAPLAVLPTVGAVSTSAHAEVRLAPAPKAPKFRTHDRLVTVHDGPDGTHETFIDTRLYRPVVATRRHPKPAILMTHGFGGSKLSAEVVHTASFLARHGYAVLTYTSQGFGDSTGCISLQSRDYDVKDARQLVTKVLEAKRWVARDRKGAIVGMVGGSYGGGIQANLAESDHRIRAIAPFRTWNTLQYSLDPNNWVAPGDRTGFTHELHDQGVFKKVWTSAFFASGQSQSGNGDPSCAQDGDGGGSVPCGGFRVEVCETFTRLSTTGDASEADRELVAGSSATTDIDDLTVPTLVVQGQSDTLFNLNDAVATYTALRERGVPVQMIWNSGGHGGYESAPGECEMFDAFGGGPAKRFGRCYLPRRVLQFFDHYLKDKGPRGPGFSFFRDWVAYDGEGPTNAYGRARHFPLRGGTTFHLAGTDALVRGTSAPESAEVSFLNPPGGQPAAYTETPNFSGPNSSPQNTTPPSDVDGQYAAFTSAPFEKAVVSVGVPEARLDLAHTAPTDLVLFLKVWDVAPDGSATLLHRLASPARIPSVALDEPVRIKLLGFAHRFAAGHAVRLTVSTTDQAYYDAQAPDVVTITTGGSTFRLPVR